MLLKLVSCWVSRGTVENIENGSRCFCHANVLCLARQPREGASPLTCRSHETPGGELARTLHPCLRETFHVLRCLIIMWYHIRSWLLVNHVISHAFPIATKSWYHTRTEILTPLDLTHSDLEISPKTRFEALRQSRSQVILFVAFWSRCKILACKVRACAEGKISSYGV